MIFADVEVALDALSHNLEACGNSAHEYFDNMKKSLRDAEGIEEASRTLQILNSSRKIVDYANFTREQEQLWNALWTRAHAALKAIDSN